jgi:hypothetical protein
MNKFHRYLNIPNYIPRIDFSQWKTDGFQWHEFHKNLSLDDLGNLKIARFLDRLGMSSDWIEVFYTPPNSSGIIHSDNGLGDDWAKIIYQFGAKGSTMRWWTSENSFQLVPGMENYIMENMEEVKGVPGKDVLGDDIDCHYSQKVLMSFEKDATMVYEAEIGQASLANTGPLHSSYNPTNEKRFVVTIGLFDKCGNRLLWDDVLTRMDQYLK